MIENHETLQNELMLPPQQSNLLSRHVKLFNIKLWDAAVKLLDNFKYAE